jgi:hypothetical protein
VIEVSPRGRFVIQKDQLKRHTLTHASLAKAYLAVAGLLPTDLATTCIIVFKFILIGFAYFTYPS